MRVFGSCSSLALALLRLGSCGRRSAVRRLSRSDGRGRSPHTATRASLLDRGRFAGQRRDARSARRLRGRSRGVELSVIRSALGVLVSWLVAWRHLLQREHPMSERLVRRIHAHPSRRPGGSVHMRNMRAGRNFGRGLRLRRVRKQRDLHDERYDGAVSDVHLRRGGGGRPRRELRRSRESLQARALLR